MIFRSKELFITVLHVISQTAYTYFSLLLTSTRFDHDMNYIDFLLIIALLIPVYTAIQKGFLMSTADLLCWLGSLLLAFTTNNFISSLLQSLAGSDVLWAQPFAFIFSAVLYKFVLDWIAVQLLQSLPVEIHTSSFNRLFGVLPGLVNGCLWAAFLATMLLLLPINSMIPAQVRSSAIAGPLASEIGWLGQKFTSVFSGGHDFIKHPPHVDAEETIKLPFKVADSKPNAALEAEMLVLINKERKLMGLQPLMADPEMRVVARKHAADMFARGYFSHHTPEGLDPFDRMSKEHVSFLTAGENLALAQSLTIAHEGLMKSPGHRANILNGTFGRVGIGIQDGGFYGLMITQNFRN